jgi:high-affinity iron transporter
MLPVLVIFFREGLEASLIVSIILSYVRRMGHQRVAYQVWAGVAAAAAVDLALGISLFHVIRHYEGSRVQTILEGITYFIAMAMLTGMSFWMKSQGRSMKASLERQVRAAISRGTLMAMVVLAFVTVGREGLETVFFTLAVAFHTGFWALLGGALIGMALALAVDWTMLRAGRRVPLNLFFNVLGGVLLVFAAALLADGIENFQALGWIPGWHVLWNTGGVLSETGVLGDILHNFVGYAASPTAVQLTCYVAFLLIGFWRYFAPAARPSTAAETAGERNRD